MAFKFDTLINLERAKKVYALYTNDGATEGEKVAAYERLTAIANKANISVANLIDKINGKDNKQKPWEYFDDAAYDAFKYAYGTYKENYYQETYTAVTDMDLAVLFALRVMRTHSYPFTLNEGTFIDDMYERFRNYMFSMRVTSKQRQYLQTIYNRYRNKPHG